MEYIIKKLGGENAAELHKSAKNIYNDIIAGNAQAVVVSAIRSPDFNTTDYLIALGKELGENVPNVPKIEKLVKSLKDFHVSKLDEKLPEGVEGLLDMVSSEFDNLLETIHYFLGNRSLEKLPVAENDFCIQKQNGESFSILGFGEAISCKIFSRVIDSVAGKGVFSKSVDLSQIVNYKDLVGKSDTEVFDILSVKISKIIIEKVADGFVPVLSGYMGMFGEGIEAAIGRGYSDATAAVCTVGLAKRGYSVVLEVQKSVKGLLSADPRVLSNPGDAKIITTLDYLMAREITGECGAQAKLLHPQALRSEVQEAGVKIHLFDPFSGEDGSWILPNIPEKDKLEEPTGVSFIGGRKNVIFFSISSGKMFESAILSRLFGIVKDYFPVDIVSTSETEISFTIQSPEEGSEKLQEMVQKIKDEFSFEENTSLEFIEYVSNKALVFCVGKSMRGYVGLMGKLSACLSDKNINIEMISQGRLQRAVVFGIDEKDLGKAVNVLHDRFI